MPTKIEKPRAAPSLAVTLATAFFALSVLALLISGGLQLFSSIQTQQATISSQQQLIAQDAAASVSSFIQEKFGALETAVRLAHPATASPEEQEQILQVLLGVQPAFRHLILLNAQDQALARASRLSQAVLEQFVGRLTGDALVQIKQTQRYISPVYIDPDTSEPLVIMAVPETSALGDVQGTLVVEVNLKFMWDLVDQLKVGNTGYAYVVDDRGSLIAFRDTALVLRGENVVSVGGVKEFVDNPSASTDITPDVVAYTGLNGTTVVGTYAPLGTPHWAVVTEMPLEEAYQETIRGIVATIGITLAIAVMAGLVGIYVARRLAVPLINLTETATRITSGDMELHAEVAGPSEVARLATAFNSMTQQLRSLISGLEQRVAERTRALATSSEVSRRLSTVLDPQQLLVEVVEQVRDAFGYYHAHIYLFDEARENLIMAGGTGDAGRTMLARGHKIALGRGLVGRAASTGEVVLVPDTRQDPNWLPNPLLPETRSEVAVPIIAAGQVIGVLDVQQSVSGGLTPSDADLLQSIANQVGIALRNALAYAQIQRQARQETFIHTVGEKLQRATTVDQVLQIAAQELTQALGARRASVQLSLSGLAGPTGGNGREVKS